MSDLDVLRQMIKDNARLSLVDSYGKKKVVLIEPQHPDSSVPIHGLPENAVVIKVDAFKSPDSVFSGANGECKRADFVIIADAGSRGVILYIEMKATKGSQKEIVQQLTGARCFVAYCREIGQAFWNQETFLTDYEERFISIGHTSISKKTTQIARQSGTHDRPDRMLKISWPNYLHFNHLAGGRR